LNIYHSSPFSALVDDSDNMLPSFAIYGKYIKELGDQIYIIYLLSELSDLNLYVVATLTQHLLEAFQ